MFVISVLLVALVIVVIGSKLAQKMNWPTPLGMSLSLCFIALILVLTNQFLGKWLTGNLKEDLIFTHAQEIGIAGLLFWAGNSFRKTSFQWTKQTLLLVIISVLQMIIITTLLVKFSSLETGAILTIAAAISCSSLWLPTTFSSFIEEKYKLLVHSSQSAAMLVTGIFLVIIHFYVVMQIILIKKLLGNTLALVLSYELLKVVMFFSVASFVASKFIQMRKNKTSKERLFIGYLLITALIFTFASLTFSQIIAAGWAFVAGLVLKYNELLNDNEQDNWTSPLFLSLIFLPAMFQSYNRSVSNVFLFIAVVVILLLAKWAITWAVLRVFVKEATLLTAISLGTMEVSLLFLAYGKTKWLVEGDYYFGILAFALLSTLLSQIIYMVFSRSATSVSIPNNSKPTNKVKGKNNHKIATVITTALLIALTATPAIAQTTNSEHNSEQVEDPVSRAMKQIDNVASQQATFTDQVITTVKELEKGKSEQNLIATKSTILEKQPLFNPFEVLSNPRYKTALVRFRQYGEPMMRILEEEKVPQQLLSVAFVESGFNPLSLSPKGARGIWQFIPATARRYGLPVDSSSDHRIDPEHSTRAAARYLRDLYERFGDWRLALAAYNAGENRIQKIIDKTGLHDFDAIARYLPIETRNYVPSVLSIWSQLGGLDSKPYVIKQDKAISITPSQIVMASFKLGLPESSTKKLEKENEK